MATSSNKNPSREGIHKDHRKRVKEKFRATGLEGFHEHNILEFLLFYAIPRCDTNEYAHLLINEFGSLSGVFDAPIEALVKVEGIGIEAATLIKLIPEVFKYYEASKVKDMKIVKSSDVAKKVLAPYFKTATYEKFVIMYLDAMGGLIKINEISQGSDFMVKTDFNVLLKTAVLLDAKGIVVAHNHPNGFALPSHEDKVLTEKLSLLCRSFDITLCEHIIFSGNETCLLSKTSGMKSGTFAF